MTISGGLSFVGKLMNGQAVQPEFHDSVTIYFSDIVGFTNFCSQQSAGEIVLLLNALYR